MSTELKSRNENISLTRFSGGASRGSCVQITRKWGSEFRHIPVTREEARRLAMDLLEFSEGEEQDLHRVVRDRG